MNRPEWKDAKFKNRCEGTSRLLNDFPAGIVSNLSPHISHYVLIAPYSTTASYHRMLPQGFA